MQLKVDEDRALEQPGTGTGILVRAQLIDGKWGSFDICELEASSLLEWLRSRGGHNPLAESVSEIVQDGLTEALKLQQEP